MGQVAASSYSTHPVLRAEGPPGEIRPGHKKTTDILPATALGTGNAWQEIEPEAVNKSLPPYHNRIKALGKGEPGTVAAARKGVQLGLSQKLGGTVQIQ